MRCLLPLLNATDRKSRKDTTPSQDTTDAMQAFLWKHNPTSPNKDDLTRKHHGSKQEEKSPRTHRHQTQDQLWSEFKNIFSELLQKQPTMTILQNSQPHFGPTRLGNSQKARKKTAFAPNVRMCVVRREVKTRRLLSHVPWVNAAKMSKTATRRKMMMKTATKEKQKQRQR